MQLKRPIMNKATCNVLRQGLKSVSGPCLWVKLPRGFETLHLAAQQKDSLEIRLARDDCRKLGPTMSIHHNELVRRCQSNPHLKDVQLKANYSQ